MPKSRAVFVRIAVAVAASVGLFAGAAPASAAPTYFWGDYRGYVIWDGERILNVDTDDDESLVVRTLGANGRRLARVPPVAGTRGQAHAQLMDATPDWVVVQRERKTFDRYGPLAQTNGDVIVIGRDGRVQRLDSWCGPPRWDGGGDVAVAGDVVVWRAFPCDGEAANEVVLHNLITASEQRLRVPLAAHDNFIGSIKFTGRWLSASEGSSDFSQPRSTHVYAVADAGEPQLRYSTQLVGDLTASGQVIACSDGKLGQASVDQPAPRPFQDGAPCQPPVHTSDGQVTWMSGDQVLVAPEEEGKPSRVLYQGAAGIYGFDNGRAVLLVKDCSGSSNGIVTIGLADQSAALPTLCPVTLGKRPSRISGSRLRVPVRCKYGCTLMFEVRTVAGRRLARGAERFNPRRRSITTKLSRRERIRVLRRGAAKIVLETRNRDGSSTTFKRRFRVTG